MIQRRTLPLLWVPALLFVLAVHLEAASPCAGLASLAWITDGLSEPVPSEGPGGELQPIYDELSAHLRRSPNFRIARATRLRPGEPPAVRYQRTRYLAELNTEKENWIRAAIPLFERWFRATGNRFTLTDGVFSFPPDESGGPLNRYAARVKEHLNAETAVDLALSANGGVVEGEDGRRLEASLALALSLAPQSTEGHEHWHLRLIQLRENNPQGLFQMHFFSRDPEAVAPQSHYDSFVSADEIIAHLYSVISNLEQAVKGAPDRNLRVRLRFQAEVGRRISLRIARSTEAMGDFLFPSLTLIGRRRNGKPAPLLVARNGSEQISTPFAVPRGLESPTTDAERTAFNALIDDTVSPNFQEQLGALSFVARRSTSYYGQIGEELRRRNFAGALAKAKEFERFLMPFLEWTPSRG